MQSASAWYAPIACPITLEACFHRRDSTDWRAEIRATRRWLHTAASPLMVKFFTGGSTIGLLAPTPARWCPRNWRDHEATTAPLRAFVHALVCPQGDREGAMRAIQRWQIGAQVTARAREFLTAKFGLMPRQSRAESTGAFSHRALPASGPPERLSPRLHLVSAQQDRLR
jgi:hypothetical protein